MNRQRVREFMSREIREQRTSQKYATNIVAYPQNDVRELAKIMRDIKVDFLPVLSSPWNKKLVGFIELNKIRVFLND